MTGELYRCMNISCDTVHDNDDDNDDVSENIIKKALWNVFAQTVDIWIWFLCCVVFLLFLMLFVFTLCFILYVCSVMCAASVV